MTKTLNIVFAGTPQFAVPCLQALLDSPHRVRAVYTQPDRPAGRGRSLQASPVKRLAEQHGLPVYQPNTLKDVAAQAALAELKPDLMVVVAYGLLLPKPVLTIPRLGCINVHASLLPRWRGAAPIQRAILSGDSETGVTLMQMDEGLDTGGMLYRVSCPIHSSETSETLHDRLSVLGAEALLNVLNKGLLGADAAEPQDEALATYATKLTKAEAAIDWHLSAVELARCVQGFNPWPVAFTSWEGKTLRVWLAEALSEQSDLPPGTLCQASQAGLDIATGSGVLRLLSVQLPGGRALKARDFVNAHQAKLMSGKTTFK